MSTWRVTAALDPCFNLVKRGLQAYALGVNTKSSHVDAELSCKMEESLAQRNKRIVDVNKYVSVAV